MECTLQPPNTVSALVDWTILSSIAVYVRIRQQDMVGVCREVAVAQLPALGVDAHCHLDKVLHDSGRTPKELFRRSDPADHLELEYLVCSLNFPQYDKWMYVLLSSPNVRFSYGWHPHVTSRFQEEDWRDHERTTRERMADPRFVAVGEVGLDYYRHGREPERASQQDYLRRIVALAVELGKPVVIHCRDQADSTQARTDCQEILTSVLPDKYPLYIHCFTGDIGVAASWKRVPPVVKFGIGPAVFKSEHQYALRATVSQLGLEELLLESDAPLMARNPYELHPVCRAVGAWKNVPASLVAEQCRLNSHRLFRFT